MLGFFFQSIGEFKDPFDWKNNWSGAGNGDLYAQGVLGISSDRDDRRIFLGLKFSIPGFFWVRKFGKYFLWTLRIEQNHM